VPARKAMVMRSGFSGFACEQFHRHEPHIATKSCQYQELPPLRPSPDFGAYFV
jgi:hypothetical protein